MRVGSQPFITLAHARPDEVFGRVTTAPARTLPQARSASPAEVFGTVETRPARALPAIRTATPEEVFGSVDTSPVQVPRLPPAQTTPLGM